MVVVCQVIVGKINKNILSFSKTMLYFLFIVKNALLVAKILNFFSIFSFTFFYDKKVTKNHWQTDASSRSLQKPANTAKVVLKITLVLF